MNKKRGDNIYGTAMQNLFEKKYVSGVNATTLGDSKPCYVFTGITQKGKSYFEMKDKHEKEQRKLSYREWKIAIVSAVIGAIIGLIPTIIQWLT